MAQVETNETGVTTVGAFPIGRIDNLVAVHDRISNIGEVPGDITPVANEGDGWLSAHANENPDVENVGDNIIGTDRVDEIHSDGWLYGDTAKDHLLGSEGIDSLFDGLGNVTLRGGPGNGDVLNGGRGNDTYFFGLGDGNTIINNFDNVLGRQDVLRFLDGVSSSDVNAPAF